MNMSLLAALAATVAVGAAIRSTWSPCGLSMLSTITPMAERSRGRRWGLTVSWFLLGAVLGGATLGLGAALLALVVSALSLPVTVTYLVAALAAGAAVALDLGVLGAPMPHHRRQVDEQWLDQYRSWVYGAGFGWQIGSGLSTYIMTAGVYLTVVLGALTGSPATAFGICVLFGAVRGLAILTGFRLTTPDRVRTFHRRFEAAGPTVRNVVIALDAVVLCVTAAAAAGPVGTAAAVGLVVVLAMASRAVGHDPAPLPTSAAVTADV